MTASWRSISTPWTTTVPRTRAEAVSLYAEFAIDYALQTIQYALISALSAMEMQLDADEPKGEA